MAGGSMYRYDYIEPSPKRQSGNGLGVVIELLKSNH